MASLKGQRIAASFQDLVKRADTYSQTGTNIEIMNDSAVVQPTGLYLESGAVTDNVGIGTAAPAHPLHIVKASTPQARFAYDGSNYLDVGYNRLDVYGGALAFYIAGTNRMSIDGNSRISLSNNDSGEDNTIFGFLAGAALVSGGDDNTLIGDYAGTLLQSGDNNVIIGSGAGVQTHTDASHNTVVGDSAFGGDHDDSNACHYNTVIGKGAMAGALDGVAGATAVGWSALAALTTGARNTAVGYSSASQLTTGSDNTTFGYNAYLSQAPGHGNHLAGSHNTFMGSQSGDGAYASTTAVENMTALGSGALSGALTGAANGAVAVGKSSLAALTSGAKNLAVGYSALQGLTTGANNIAIGYEAADAMVGTESDNIAIGYGAMGAMDEDNESIDSNIAIGRGAMFGGDMASGDADRDYTKNIAIGNYAMDDCGYIGGTDNVFIGEDSGGGTWTGDESNYNIGIGNYAMDAAMAGAENNTAVGYNGLTGIIDGAGNTAVGFNSGTTITSGDNNICIGSTANVSAVDADNQIVIGWNATGQGDNTVVLGSNDITGVYMGSSSAVSTVYCSGVNFPDTQAASADANTLDDYEEGTWTPAFGNLTEGSATITGKYTKIGNLVYAQGSITWAADTSASGSITVTNLPFTVANDISPIGNSYLTDSGTGSFFGKVKATVNSTTLALQETNTAAGGAGNIEDDSPFTWTTSDVLFFEITYRT